MPHYPGFHIEDLLECGHARVARVVPVQMLLLEVIGKLDLAIGSLHKAGENAKSLAGR
ncbi:Uncharacterised protein [Burkholderia pseudomallei]|nr:Uncharacterised protein [Burkholderia pseudomallei]